MQMYDLNRILCFAFHGKQRSLLSKSFPRTLHRPRNPILRSRNLNHTTADATNSASSSTAAVAVRTSSSELPLQPRNNVALELNQLNGVIGGNIWPSAPVLCRHLLFHYYYNRNNDSSRHCHHFPYHKMNVVELGSGTGAVGLYASGLRIFNSVYLTEHRPPVTAVMSSVPYNVDGTLDLLQDEDCHENKKSDRLLQLLMSNIELNHDNVMKNSATKGGGHSTSTSDTVMTSSWPPEVHELDWTQPDHVKEILAALEKYHSRDGHATINVGFDLILASDVTYTTELHVPLARTISELLLNQEKNDSNGDTEGRGGHSQPLPTCLVAHQRRIVNPFSFVSTNYDVDYQLDSFRNALDIAELIVVAKHDYNYHPEQEHQGSEIIRDSSTSNAAAAQKTREALVSIFEIQHKH